MGLGERLTALRHRADRRAFLAISRHRHRRLAIAGAHLARQYLEAVQYSSGYARHNGENDLLERLASQRPVTIVDCGANIGSWTLAARRSFPRATIHAFEPIPETLEALRRATAADPLVIVHGYALSDAPGAATMNVDDRDRATASLARPPAAVRTRDVTVELATGDDFAVEHGIDHLRLLKIDAEGHDLAVLTGFASMIGERRIDVVQFEVSGWNAATRTWIGQFYDVLEPAGYVVGKVVPGGVELGPYTSAVEDFRSTGNFAAVRTDDAALVAAVAGASTIRR